jgi:coenzyme F420 hydrogenase subunit beta
MCRHLSEWQNRVQSGWFRVEGRVSKKWKGACKDVCQRMVTFALKISPNIFGFKAKPPSLLDQM